MVPKTTDSKETFAHIREWLEDCTATHEHCGRGVATKLPTRILDLGHLESTGIVRLVETIETAAEFARYACLSHCWGGKIAETAVTTTVNLKSMKEGIPIEHFPQTFQDAVRMTRRLGLQYLWIDSMCILQDDESDWDRESCKMASVYSGAYITIAATCSRNSNEGCIRASNPMYAPVLISSKCRTKDGRPFDLYIRQQLPHFHEAACWSAHPLLGRAWVYQERLLSPRFLHFAREEVIWECNEYTSCQCSPLPKGDSSLFSPRWRPATKQIYSKAIRSRDTQILLAAWWHVVADYDQLALSFEKDRLRAIAGIADQISAAGTNLGEETPNLGRYIEGIWECSLLEDLCWTASVNRLRDERTRKPEWLVPTWSWASSRRPFASTVSGNDTIVRGKSFARILEFGYTKNGLACQGHVQYNYIRLKLSSICEMTLGKKGDEEWFDGIVCLRSENGQYLEWDSKTGERKAGMYMDLSPDYDLYEAAGDDRIGLGSKIVCGFVSEHLSSETGVGLLLRLVDEEHGLYKRAGSFHVVLEDWHDSYSHKESQLVVTLV